MEKTIQELREIIPFKSTTQEGDVVLAAIAEPRSFFYAVVAEIVRDETKRDEWWCVTMHILSLPPQKVVWTLRESQFTGQEMFTMDGVGHFVQAVDFSEGTALKDLSISSRPKKKSVKGRRGAVLKLVK